MSSTAWCHRALSSTRQRPGRQDERLTLPTLPQIGALGGSDVWLAKTCADLALPICRCVDEPHPTHAIVRACSKVASHYGAAGYKVMRLIARAPWTSTLDLLNATLHTTGSKRKSRVCLLSRQAPCSSSLPPCSRLSRRRPGNVGVRF